ncbi:MAG: hypothetical protein GC160_03020 [Acidobacteria bacterium]|nr:hypothetical protein [Acidobacteriota bacterium]
MRALLKAVGVESYPVAIYSGDRRFVREQWPSPQQFNHAILAVQAPEGADLPAITEVEGLGRLLFFDPTSQSTAFGWLPEHEQDSWALLVDADKGRLVRAPSVEPEANLLRRTIEARLTVDGAMEAKIREVASGAAAAHNRSLYKEMTEPEYRRVIERWVARGTSSAQVASIQVDAAEPGFSLDVELSAPSYAQSMAGRLLVFKPALVERRGGLYWDEEDRAYPVTLDADAFEESVRFDLPEGFRLDEKPEDIGVEKEFGEYTASWRLEEGRLLFQRRLLLRNAVVPAESYNEIREFFSAVVSAEQAPVVLVKE